jgi:phage baseplate assembly protein V
MLAELKRLIGNIANYGTITQTKSSDGKSLARVKVGERETDFLPVVSISNSFKKHFIPIRVGEQCVMISPFGEANGGFIIRSIFNKGNKEPSLANETTEVMEYEDGTVITYDTKAKELKVNASDKITIICKSASVTANNVIIDSPSIDLGTGGKGVVTGDCICAFTGKAHHDFSSNTRSAK